MTMPTLVWAEIPVRDLDAAQRFYETVFGYALTRQEMGPNVTLILGEGTSGHLYEGVPATGGNGPTIHLAVTGSVEDAMGRCDSAGGKVVSPVIEIPVGRFAYATDPDGNSIGLFEAKAA